jgi:SAM-dependent methyltransferase
MRRDAPDFLVRAELTELMDGPCSREEFRACLRDLARVNRWLMAYRPLLQWLESLALRRMNRPTRILDVGCGYGDTLRRVERWASEGGVAVELTGLDLNPDAVAIAAEASGSESTIEWEQTDVFLYESPKPIDLVISSLFTHHLAEADVVRFVRWTEEHAEMGWCINDLSRAVIPYHLFRAFSKLMGLHRFVQHDGPVSIARSFVPADWQRMCAAVGLQGHDVLIRAYTPGRLCVMRRKPR